jgi:hypothetical protein
MSLDTLGLSPEQKPAVEKIRSDLHARMEPARAAEQNLLGTLADGLAVGVLDPAKVDAAVGQLTKAAASVPCCTGAPSPLSPQQTLEGQ